ncbi:MAG: hypothetical protein MUE42_12595 [Opitutaceae bacterium]|nr:hypothetical protein [Opitutaceae bacterium]
MAASSAKTSPASVRSTSTSPPFSTTPNELVNRVGADRERLRAAGHATGADFEKKSFIPGIYDRVALSLCVGPRIAHLQVAPEPAFSRALVEVRGETSATLGELAYTVTERFTGRVVAEGRTEAVGPRHLFSVALPGFTAWTPDSPFLYDLVVTSAGDRLATPFGMRSFEFDPTAGHALLNGKPCYLRGTNVCIHRFFEDPSRARLPWDEAWVRGLFRAFKAMHWNALRFSIGAPPRFWYDVADEEGFLIQDEFAIWADHGRLRLDVLADVFEKWMRAHANHPSVVIWDAQNETGTALTRQVVRAVRGIDLSDRPWDLGWDRPTLRPTDPFEAHVYWVKERPNFEFSDLATENPVPHEARCRAGLAGPTSSPVIINEYGWCWIDREGRPTRLAREDKIFERWGLPAGSSPEAYRREYAHRIAMETEFWRMHRSVAGYMHFSDLGYSRENGETSDNWLDVAALRLEPHYERMMRHVSAPLGVMLDAWDGIFRAANWLRVTVPVHVVNDLDVAWSGPVELRLAQDGRELWRHVEIVAVGPFGAARFHITPPWPQTFPTDVVLTAALVGPGGVEARSVRRLRLIDGMAGGNPTGPLPVVA